jgi:glycosyltransferase involved in cell wall biosynthesis
LTKTHLSLCMIVKNEEECISRCLNSVKDVVDEIIIVDTGSTDRTIEICQSYQAQIEKFEWNGSFADARNYSIKKATGDWIIWLDADEELDETNKKKLHEGTHFDEYDVINIHLINYYGDKIDPNYSTDVGHTRLFRNNGIKFVNKMHEYLDYDHIDRERIGYLNIKVHHYGYLDPIMKKKEKSKRNLRMLEEQLKNGEKIYWAHYYIALEHYNKQEYQEALERVNLSILAFLQKMVLPLSMVYKLKYSILIAMKKFSEALHGIERAIYLYPDYVDLRFFKGLILYNLEKYEESLKCFKECIDMGEDNRDHLILKGVGSFQAWYYTSLCLQKLNKLEDAVVALMNGLLIAPEFKEALDSFSQVLKDEEMLIIECMNKHFQGEPLQTLRKIIQNISG